MQGGEIYEAPLAPRFRTEAAPEGGQIVVVPAQRQLFLMAFLVVWLCGWTLGGMSAFASLMRGFQPFLAFWLCGWALGEAFVAMTLAWMAAGRETLRVVGGDLEISAELFGYARRRRYRGAQIRDLSSSQYNPYRSGRRGWDLPLAWPPGSGGVKFTYGARTIYAGVGLDEPEGRMIVDLLKRRLPKSPSHTV